MISLLTNTFNSLIYLFIHSLISLSFQPCLICSLSNFNSWFTMHQVLKRILKVKYMLSALVFLILLSRKMCRKRMTHQHKIYNKYLCKMLSGNKREIIWLLKGLNHKHSMEAPEELYFNWIFTSEQCEVEKNIRTWEGHMNNSLRKHSQQI